MAKQDPDEVSKRLLREAAEEALANASDNDPAVAKWLDDDLEAGMTEILGMRPDALQAALNEAIPDLSASEVDAALRDARAARKAMEGGWLSGPNPELAANILKGNKNLKGYAKTRGEKSCFIAGVVLLAGAGALVTSAVWGAHEVVSALLR